jgi:ribose transport system permease protein
MVFEKTMSTQEKRKSRIYRTFSDYGMLAILLLLCLLFSIMTIREQHPVGARAAEKLLGQLQENPLTGAILIIAQPNDQDKAFAEALTGSFQGRLATFSIHGDPAAIRNALISMQDTTSNIAAVITTESYAPSVSSIIAQFPSLAQARVITPPSYRWPTFLLADNLRNVANQIAVIAIIAIGMTMVIITAGIDLSVGSLIALAAVVTAWLIGAWGGTSASGTGMFAAGLVAMALCGLTGAFSGLMITRFKVPPFIATLAIMQVAAGIAYIISQGKPIYQLPDSFIGLGRGADPLLKIPYAVILMLVLYWAAHFLMTRTTLGRYIYAVGGNSEAARLAGIRINGVLFFVYTLCGVLAGLGGVVMASQLKSGAPTYGLTYELYVIAAVVVGGTSLSGGEGRILGTLIGAFIIAVIQNGMNLTNVETYTQKVVLGLVILVAVLLDRIKQRRLARVK